MNENDKLFYKRKGFLGFDESDRVMFFVEKLSFRDVKVLYKGQEMLVAPWEIEVKNDK